MTSQAQQQKVGVGGQGSLGSTWSDPSVNISLDFLSAGLNSAKTPPTLNNIIQQQGNSVVHTNSGSGSGCPYNVTTLLHFCFCRSASRQPVVPELWGSQPELPTPYDAHQTSFQSHDGRRRHDDGHAYLLTCNDNGNNGHGWDTCEPRHDGNEHEHESGHGRSGHDEWNGNVGSGNGPDSPHPPCHGSA